MSYNLPAGAANHPDAPWNQPSNIPSLECPICQSEDCFEAYGKMISIKRGPIVTAIGVCRNCWHKSYIEDFENYD